MKTIIVSLLILFSVSSASYGSDIDTVNGNADPSAFKKSYNVVYQFINNHEYLLVPLSGLMAGARICGAWCAAAGGIAGIADEISVYFGVTDKRYLTWGVFGAATGHAISPTLPAELAGVAFGVLLPTGIIGEHQEVIAPLAAALAGNSALGVSGMIAGGMAGALDEVLLNKGITDNHYLTFATIGQALSGMLGSGFGPTVSNFVGTMLGAVVANYEKELIGGVLTPVKTVNDLYTTYSKFIPQQLLNTHIEKQAVALVGSQFLTQLLSAKSSKYNQDITYNFERLNDGGKAWGGFKTQCVYYAVFLFPYALGQTFTSSINDYFEKKLHFTIEDKVTADLFIGETALRLAQDKNTTVLTDSMKDDISTVVSSGSWLVTDAISTAINGAYGVGVIIVSSPNLFVYSALYEKANAFVSEQLAAQRRVTSEKIKELNSQLVSTFKHDTENMRTIAERSGIQVTGDKVKQLSGAIREHEGTQKIWSMANQIWWSIAGTANFMLRYYLIGNEINEGKIKFEDRSKVQIASWQVSNLLSWMGRKAMDQSYIQESLDRVVILEGKIHAASNQVDQINRVFQESNQLILQELEIGIGERLLVATKELKLDLGKVYAITGESGCGKTSLLSKIKGLKENGVFGKGNIYYPKIDGREPRIVMLSQQDYFPLDTSLQGIILYPDKITTDPGLNQERREEMLLLLKEIGLHAFNAGVKNSNAQIEMTKKPLNLDSKKDWYTYLSGGEKKKIMIVSAIIKKPDILILDEIFNGLDLQSIKIVQQMLKKYLPNTLMLIVDHHAVDNNYGGFYDNELHFGDKDIVFQEIEARDFLKKQKIVE